MVIFLLIFVGVWFFEIVCGDCVVGVVGVIEYFF